MLDLSNLQIGLLIASLLFTGVVAGILAGLLGVGGGIVIVPVLFWIFGLLALPAATSMHLAVGSSLATIIATSWASMRAHRRRGSVDESLLRRWGPAIFVGAAIGGVAAKFINGDGLRLIFGVIALLVAINMALPRQLKVSDALPKSGLANRAIAAVIQIFDEQGLIGRHGFRDRHADCDSGRCRLHLVWSRRSAAAAAVARLREPAGSRAHLPYDHDDGTHRRETRASPEPATPEDRFRRVPVHHRTADALHRHRQIAPHPAAAAERA